MYAGGVGLVAVCMNLGVWRETCLLGTLKCRTENQANLSHALAIEKATEANALVGLFYAGVPPYFVERRYLDFLGKSEKHIARLPVRSRWRSYRHNLPGHMKWSWPYAIGECKPDVITQNTGQWIEFSRDFQKNYGKYCLVDDEQEENGIWIRMTSRRVKWSELRPAEDTSARLPVAVDDPSEESMNAPSVQRRIRRYQKAQGR